MTTSLPPGAGSRAGSELSGGDQPSAARGLPGVIVAGITALVSGISVFANSYGVHSIAVPAVYTTAKNLVATLVLALCALVAQSISRRRPGSAPDRFVTGTSGTGVSPGNYWRTWGPARWAGLAYVGVAGGGIAFVLFFDGLADTTATPAAFWHDTLVVWVAVLALVFLREHVSWWNVGAIGVLVAGQVAIVGGVGHLAANRGELLVLSATVIWAVEVIVAKRLLRDMAPVAVGLARMGVGAAALVAYLAATGTLHVLLSFHLNQAGWALLTGGLLAAYVGTWMTALARARAVDVTSVLVASVVVTALLQAVAGTGSLAPQALGLVFVVFGAVVVLWASLRQTAVHRPQVASR